MNFTTLIKLTKKLIINFLSLGSLCFNFHYRTSYYVDVKRLTTIKLILRRYPLENKNCLEGYFYRYIHWFLWITSYKTTKMYKYINGKPNILPNSLDIAMAVLIIHPNMMIQTTPLVDSF